MDCFTLRLFKKDFRELFERRTLLTSASELSTQKKLILREYLNFLSILPSSEIADFLTPGAIFG